MMRISKGREEVFEGMTIAHDLVAPTLGPRGKNVVLDRGFSVPIITNDGVSILQAIQVENDTHRQGVELLKGGAKKTNEQAGDGTTTFTVLAYSIIKEGMAYDNPMEVKRSLEKAGIKVVEELRTMAKEVKTDKEILQVATLSAESEEIGGMIADTFKAIGRDGIINVEQSSGRDTEVKIVDGYEVGRGYAHGFMANKRNGNCELANVAVLVVGERLSNAAELVPFLNACLSSGVKEMAVFCPEAEPEILNTFALNKQNGTMNILLVKCATQNNEVLHDVAIVTGATYVAKDEGYRFDTLSPLVLGKAGKIIATAKQTNIAEGAGDPSKKVEELKSQLGVTTDDNEYDLVESRIARLKREIAVIKVGGKTEEAMQYSFYKIEDAVNATKAAIEEGIVEGGGMSLYRISQKLGDTVGEKILAKALKLPLRHIIENGGGDYTEVLVNLPKDKGYNAATDEYVDMIKSGIIDPVKVERCAVENAVSLAANFLTTHASVSLIRKPTNDAQE